MYLVLIMYFSLALSVSFLCSLLEAVILSISPAYVNILIEKKPKAGKLLKQLTENIDRPLSAILTLNTVAHTIGAAGVGAEVQNLWPEVSSALSISAAIMTILVLVFSEIIPKTLGAVHWKKLATSSAFIIKSLVWILYPIVRPLEAISDLLSHGEGRSKISREEMMATVEIGKLQGTLLKQETRVIKNMLCLQSMRVKDILTPRSVLVAFQENKTFAEIIKEHNPIPFSRIPVYGKNLDDITGFVHRYLVLQAFSQDKDNEKVKSIANEVHAIPDTKSVSSTLDEFIQRKEQMFLVVDEYGGTAGIITLEDTIETLLGVEIVDEFDTVEDMRKYALQQWEKRKRERKKHQKSK